MDIKTHSSFLPLFISQTTSKTQCTTTDQIPLPHQLSSQLQALFLKHPSLRLISLNFKSQWCQKYVRAMLLQQFKVCAILPDNQNIMIFNQIQISSDSNEDAFYWAYSEVGAMCPEKWKMMVMLISNTILFQVCDVENDGKMLLNIAKNRQQIMMKEAQLILLHSPSLDISGIEEEVKRHFSEVQIISIGNQVNLEQAEAQLFKNILEERSMVLKKSKKMGMEEINIESEVMLKYWLHFEQEVNLQVSNVKESWNKFSTAYIEEIIDKGVERYQSKMRQSFEDKKINHNKLQKMHEDAFNQCFSYLQTKISLSPQIQKSLIIRIKKEYEDVLSTVKQNSLKLGKSYLNKQFVTIQNRIKNKGIKSCQNLKQQLQIFCEFVHKKSQFNIFEEFNIFFTQFLLNKTIQCVRILYEDEKTQKEKDIVDLNTRIEQLENENNEIKKALMKKESELARNSQAMQQKLIYFQSKQELLEQTIERQKREIENLENSIALKVELKEQEFLPKMQEFQNNILLLKEEAEEKKKQNMLLFSQIEKEKLLHQQTITNYETLLGKQKKREEQLSYELESLTMQSLEDVQNLKKSSLKQMESSEVTIVEKEKQIKSLKLQLKQLTEKWEEWEEKSRKEAYQNEIKISELTTNYKQIELAFKIAQQENLESESKIIRWKVIEDEKQKLERLREEDISLRKESEKGIALLEQKINFLEDQLNDEENKNSTLLSQNEYLKNKLEDLHETKNINSRVNVDEWVQTQPQNNKNQQLEKALAIIDSLETEYNKLRLQKFRQKCHP